MLLCKTMYWCCVLYFLWLHKAVCIWGKKRHACSYFVKFLATKQQVHFTMLFISSEQHSIRGNQLVYGCWVCRLKIHTRFLGFRRPFFLFVFYPCRHPWTHYRLCFYLIFPNGSRWRAQNNRREAELKATLETESSRHLWHILILNQRLSTFVFFNSRHGNRQRHIFWFLWKQWTVYWWGDPRWAARWIIRIGSKINSTLSVTDFGKVGGFKQKLLRPKLCHTSKM